MWGSDPARHTTGASSRVFSLLLAFVSFLGFAFQNDPSFQKQVLDCALRLMPVIGPQIRGHVTHRECCSPGGGVGGRVVDGTQRHVGDGRRARSRLGGLGAVTVAATAAVGLAGAGPITPAMATLVSMPAAAGVDLVVLPACFRLLTAVPATIRQVLPGAALAAACGLLLQALGGVYVTQVLKGSSQSMAGPRLWSGSPQWSGCWPGC